MLHKMKRALLKPIVIYAIAIIYSLYLKINFSQIVIVDTLHIYFAPRTILYLVLFAPLLEEFGYRYWIGIKKGWLKSITIISLFLGFVENFLGLIFRYTSFGNPNERPLYNIEVVKEWVLKIIEFFVNLSEYSFILEDYVSNGLVYGLSYLINATTIYLLYRLIMRWEVIKSFVKNIKLPSLNIWWQVGISAFLFSFSHLGRYGYYFDTWYDDLFFYFLGGLFFGFARVKHGLWAAVALHSLLNAISAFYLFEYAREDLIVYGNGYIRDYYNELAFYYIVLALTFTASISYLTYKTFFEKRIKS